MKLSKCSFEVTKNEYFGHTMNQNGFQVVPKKVEAMKNWPHSNTLKNLRGILSLTSYYHKFVENYRKIATPLIELLKNNSLS